MIKKYISYLLLFFVLSCSNIEFVLKDKNEITPLKNRTLLLIDKNTGERFARGLHSYFGNTKEYDYILNIKFTEKKENRIVKSNQVAEKIEYTLKAEYDLFYKIDECRVFKKTVISKFSFTPKSGGHNFGSDRSFDSLYNNSVDQNINNFINTLQINKGCLSEN